MTIDDAQQDLRRAYVGGGTGVLCSALVWLAAAATQHRLGTGAGFAVLFFGGMLIAPGAVLVARTAFGRAAEAKGNPVGRLVLESTPALIGGLLVAWLFLPLRPDLVFPIAALAVGTRYFLFQTAYGDHLYWVLAALISGTGLLAIFRVLPISGASALMIGAIELTFAGILMWQGVRSAKG